MAGLAIALGSIGFLMTVTGGVFTYLGRSRADQPRPYTTPKGYGLALTFTIVGAVVAFAGLLVSVSAPD